MIFAEDLTKNRFEAQNPVRIASKTLLKPKTRRGLRQKRFLDPKPGVCRGVSHTPQHIPGHRTIIRPLSGSTGVCDTPLQGHP